MEDIETIRCNESVYLASKSIDMIDAVEKGYEKGYIDGYLKAIDSFAEKLKLNCTEHFIDCDGYFGGISENILYKDNIDNIAEQLIEIVK